MIRLLGQFKHCAHRVVLATVTRPHHPPRTLPSGVGASSWVSRRVAGRWLLPLRDLGEGDHLCRSLAVQPFPIAFRTELRQGKPPGLLPMVGESPALLRIQTQLTRHLDMQVTQVKPPLGFRPDVEAGFRLLHDIPFFGQPAVRASHLGQSPLSTVGERPAAWTGQPWSQYGFPCRGMRKHTREYSGPAMCGRGLSPRTAGAGRVGGGQAASASLGRSSHRLTSARHALPRQASPTQRSSSPHATRSRALRTGGVVSTIPDLHAVGSALLRPRP